jgi:hypothetical protein
LDDLNAKFLCLRVFGSAATAGGIGYLPPIAEPGDVRIEDRADHEVCAIGDIKRSRRRVHNRAYAQDGLGQNRARRGSLVSRARFRKPLAAIAEAELS